ncbi:hypothetical protein [Kitasatospora sp. NPDC050543]|uniref:hypothetical protein n=1 Tax=Kitasatospora sp. NPDC050543 TaxID=3364054 RepID=UPI00379F95A5
MGEFGGWQREGEAPVALREYTETAVDRPGGQPTRHGRHSRPKPFGGRLRLPTLRFSGAAMAMSTVVGISIATTWLLSEQQGVARRAGIAAASPPPPARGADEGSDQPQPGDGRESGDRVGAPSGGAPSPRGVGPLAGVPGSRSSARATPSSGPSSAPATTPASEPGPSADAGPSANAAPASPGPDAPGPDVPTADPSGSTASPSASPTAGASPSGSPSPGSSPSAAPEPHPIAPTPGAPDADQALFGTAVEHPLGHHGNRHILNLAITEPLTALQAEFRLSPTEVAPGSTAWTDLAGAEVTVSQERGTLVYRFSAPAGTDVQAGHYTFGVRGARPAPVDAKRPTETWTASGFGITRPRAVATSGAFLRPTPPPVPSPSASPTATASPSPAPSSSPAPSPTPARGAPLPSR